MFWSVIYWGCGYFELCYQEWDSSGSSWALLKSYSSKIKSLIGGLGSVLAFCKVGALGGFLLRSNLKVGFQNTAGSSGEYAVFLKSSTK